MELHKQLKSGKPNYRRIMMFSFLKILVNNVISGPSTDPYPFGPTFEPDALRGKIKFNEDACLLCNTCVHVCAGGAIKIEESKDKSGKELTVWHNTCCFCGLCEFYCPTKAIKLTNDYHTAHKQEDKYTYIERGFVKYNICSCCSEKMPPVVPELLAVAFKDVNSNIEELVRLCPSCRQKENLRLLKGDM
ncbi:MAG: formate hydrogenlyase subunit 6/NADH:ubiquinone oxidoreductase subunit I [Sulfurimonas sp.]|jgi:formate hydrogenlyase subunit 6/NADH:ubiquinone oxidoreductase subunit I